MTMETMLFLTTITIFLICAQGAILPPVPIFNERIVGGSPAQIQEAPYQAALLFVESNGNTYYQCGGSVIDRKIIITSAYCTNSTRYFNWRIRAGSSFHNTGGQTSTVDRIVQHPNFNINFDNDISIIILNSPFTLNSTVAVIPLPVQGQTVDDDVSAFVTGWGKTDESDENSIQLHKVVVPTVNLQQCTAAYASINPITSNMICAGSAGKDACLGDSGGPLVIRATLFGVTSWGNGCGLPDYPGVYTRVSMYREWIDSSIQSYT